ALLNPNQVTGNLKAMALNDNTYITGANYVRPAKFEVVDIDNTKIKQGSVLNSNSVVSFANDADGTDMPVADFFAGYEFVIPHFRYRHEYYVYSPYGDAEVMVTTDVSKSYTIARGKMLTIKGGDKNTLSAIIRSDLPVMISHAAQYYSGYLADTYTVPPASKEIFGIFSRLVIIGALEDNTSITIYASDGSEKSIVLNAGGRYMHSGNGSLLQQGKGSALRLVADKPIAAIQGADRDGIEATAFFGIEYFARTFGLPINSQYLAVACKQQAKIDLYDTSGVIVDSQTCTPTITATGLLPGKAYFGSADNGSNLDAGQYIQSDQPVYVILESAETNDEKNLLGLF
uniref:hypothetical protein n=1 Tax=sulfur-oxidizing endosymbiont of Gigantopelta aegis TaxID=2794934 RepID=UPI0018DCB298